MSYIFTEYLRWITIVIVSVRNSDCPFALDNQKQKNKKCWTTKTNDMVDLVVHNYNSIAKLIFVGYRKPIVVADNQKLQPGCLWDNHHFSWIHTLIIVIITDIIMIVLDIITHKWQCGGTLPRLPYATGRRQSWDMGRFKDARRDQSTWAKPVYRDTYDLTTNLTALQGIEPMTTFYYNFGSDTTLKQRFFHVCVFASSWPHGHGTRGSRRHACNANLPSVDFMWHHYQSAIELEVRFSMSIIGIPLTQLNRWSKMLMCTAHSCLLPTYSYMFSIIHWCLGL